ncbi:L-threonine 3-dehydrogenase [Synoicihabitans lomoniglobus]|uniref:L-threonine 3-dehydrogenase n=1 Tax=Synoicihabitans lomoniglobus TaxID=2909285 RepID=A0AAF0CR31_9BACT|nr:L-threonine 3-dehydrogenase [Opitutaceae bacterium LMO-M01]WED66505.1 L-threonine 3-dehydrogenase [Opitutaceae bacterium LMO-M01]
MPERTMRAIAKTAAGPGLSLIETAVPQLGINDVLIRIKRTSICGTDVHIYNWDAWAEKTIKAPLIIGHEFVGEIVEVGQNVQGFVPGDLVDGEGHIVCGQCRNCLAGRRHLCKASRGVGVNRDGAFAEYLCLPASNAVHVDKSIPLDVLSCFDPLGNATHTALQWDLVGEDILITGAGPIGCMATAIARKSGARNIVVTDVNDQRLALAARMGATATVNVAHASLRDMQQQIKMKEGFDIGLEMSGNPAALREMIDNMAHGGRIALLGIMPESAAIDWNKVVFNMLTLRGIYGREMYETWYKMTALIQSGLDITPVITHRFPFTAFEEGFDLMRSGRSGKIILDWENTH